MNATDVIGYTYEADHHCVSCTEARFPGSTDWRAEGFDPANYVDDEGNEVHPLFASDEWFNVSELCETLSCSDCRAEIDTAHSADCHENFGDGPCKLTDRFVVVVNMPGYLPEAEPTYFETQAEAEAEVERIAAIDGEDDPEYLGEHYVVSWDVLEFE